ncbi:hypothetical protein HK098_005050 [Nowakowskiella sp. JEL0407]|nr:hypothetical protein HK098_005050 [Nowakowskiella sp. JEL0407]
MVELSQQLKQRDADVFAFLSSIQSVLNNPSPENNNNNSNNVIADNSRPLALPSSLYNTPLKPRRKSLPQSEKQILTFTFLSSIQPNFTTQPRTLPDYITDSSNDGDSESDIEIEDSTPQYPSTNNNLTIKKLILERRHSDASRISFYARNNRVLFLYRNSIVSSYSIFPFQQNGGKRNTPVGVNLGNNLQARRYAGSMIRHNLAESPGVYTSPYSERELANVKRKKGQVVSFSFLLEPSGCLQATTITTYNPTELDDPELKTGRNRTVITLPSYMSSIIHYSKPNDLKRELNEHFREQFPGIGAGLTLSKIRMVKQRLIKICMDLGGDDGGRAIELSSLACSFVFFEKLCLKGIVNKQNRKLIASVCLLLAVKVNDPKEYDYKVLLDAIDNEFDISSKNVLGNELFVYTSLEFQLFLPLVEVMPHLDRIVSIVGGKGKEDYLLNQFWFSGRS